MSTTPEGDWTPPADPAPATEAAAPVAAPPVPTADVTTGPVAEAPAATPEPVADPTPVASATDTGVTNAAPPEPVAADPTVPTPTGDGSEAPLSAPVPTVQTASNAVTTSPEQSLRTEAAKAYHLIGHLINVAHEVQGKIERFVPPEVLAAGEQEALVLLRELL